MLVCPCFRALAWDAEWIEVDDRPAPRSRWSDAANHRGVPVSAEWDRKHPGASGGQHESGRVKSARAFADESSVVECNASPRGADRRLQSNDRPAFNYVGHGEGAANCAARAGQAEIAVAGAVAVLDGDGGGIVANMLLPRYKVPHDAVVVQLPVGDAVAARTGAAPPVPAVAADAGADARTGEVVPVNMQLAASMGSSVPYSSRVVAARSAVMRTMNPAAPLLFMSVALYSSATSASDQAVVTCAVEAHLRLRRVRCIGQVVATSGHG